MKILVVGAGATGGYFGARLAGAGRDVTFLVRPGRAAALRARGLVVRSPHGDARVTPSLATAADLTAHHDLVLLTVKAYALDRAVVDLAPAVGPRTVVLPVLNGLRHVDLLADRFGAPAVLGGVCQVTTTLDPDGVVHQLNDRHEIAFGALDPRTDVDRVAEALGGAGFTARRSDRILAEMWEKWVYVAAVGAITCLMRGLVGAVVAAPGGREFAERVLDECAAVAAAAGHPVRDDVLARTRAVLTEAGSTATSSLYRDLVRGAQVEADHVIGDLVDRAAAAGVDVPLLRLTRTHLDVHRRTRPQQDGAK